MKQKVIGVIPARYKSTRFEGKALADILGKPMVQHVYERACKAKTLDKVLVATDDKRIFSAVKDFGGEVVMTSESCPTGTDRIAEVMDDLDFDIVANIQGDEPLLDPVMVDEMIQPFFDDPEIQVSTLVQPISSEVDYRNPNVVKVSITKDWFAMYFSRASIPSNLDKRWYEGLPAYRHVGLYAYKRDCLLKFTRMPKTQIEKVEKLEQLRLLENGIPIKVVETKYSTIGVDTPADLERVIKVLRNNGEGVNKYGNRTNNYSSCS